MSHEHKLRDTDPYFRIDPDTRLITDLSDKGTMIVQGDHNSERFTFELPRFIDGHDMSMCNVVEIHYINIGSNERHNDVYEIPEEDRETIRLANSTDEALLCTWLLSQNATSLAGTLSFALRFMCTSTGEDGEAIIDYSWGTGIYTKTIITPGINNSEAVVEQYADVLEEWRQQLFSGGGTSVSQSANAFVKMVSGEAIRVDDVSPIKHKAKVKVSGKNLLNIDGMVNSSFVKNNDGSYTLTKIGSGRFTNLVDISIPANTIVTVSARKVEGTADGFALQTLNEDGTYTSIVSLSQTKTYASAKVTSNTESIRLYLGAGDTDGTYVTISDLQIELGNTATEYESYVNPTTTTVTACGKNFWQSKLNYPRTVSGVTIDYDPETQIYTFNGASTAAGDLYTMPNNTHIMTINPGETWTLKVEVMGGDVDGNPTSSGKISPLVNTSTYTNTIHANAESLYMTKKYTEVADITKMYFYVYAAGIVFNNLKLRIQFELSDKPTEFEKFVEFTNYTPDSNGNIEIDSISPTMTVLTDTDSAIIYLTYNRDLNKVMGDVESALDIMLNIQNVLIGGAN